MHISKIGRKSIQGIHTLLDTCFLVLILLLLAFGGYVIWDARQIYGEASSTRYELYKPREEDGGLSFGALQQINPEVMAWLTIYGTEIDYPIAQATDNSKYVNTNIQGEYALSGSIFLDYRNAADFSDFNSIVYGHHMAEHKMFGDLEFFQGEDYFAAHSYGNLYYNGKDHGIELIAYIHADAYDFTLFSPAMQGEAAAETYLTYLLELATYRRDVEVTTKDRLILLTTCSGESTNGRHVVLGRITDTVYANPYEDLSGAEKNGTSAIGSTDRQDLGWDSLPAIFWQLLGLFVLLVLCAAICKYWTYRKRKNKEKSREDEWQRKKEEYCRPC